MAPCSAAAAPFPSSLRSPGSVPGTSPPRLSFETRNRAGLVLRAHRCHRPWPASARNPSTPVFGPLTYVEPITSAVSAPRRFGADRLEILAAPVLCSDRQPSSLLSVTRVP